MTPNQTPDLLFRKRPYLSTADLYIDRSGLYFPQTGNEGVPVMGNRYTSSGSGEGRCREGYMAGIGTMSPHWVPEEGCQEGQYCNNGVCHPIPPEDWNGGGGGISSLNCSRFASGSLLSEEYRMHGALGYSYPKYDIRITSEPRTTLSEQLSDLWDMGTNLYDVLSFMLGWPQLPTSVFDTWGHFFGDFVWDNAMVIWAAAELSYQQVTFAFNSRPIVNVYSQECL